MELTQEFRVGISVPEAWKVLTDVERIAPMLPGAELQEVEGDEYRGVVKVKVGPIVAQYKGKATFEERDEEAGRVVLHASGRDTRGQGNASATITATMEPDGDGTRVSVVTDLTITGKVAQFGRGVLAEVSAKLMGQFVDALEADLAGSAGGADDAVEPSPGDDSGSGATTTQPMSDDGAGAETATGPRRIEGPGAEPVDLLSVASDSVLKRLAPIAGVVLLLLVVGLRRRARRARQARAEKPGLSRLAANLPSPADIAGNLPSVSDIAAHLPDIRVPDVRAGRRGGRRDR
jgi:uncharacterized protein